VVPLGQIRPHAPQFDGLELVSTQLEPQSVRPMEQAQAPAVHDEPDGQEMPQLPQFDALVLRSTHEPAQLVVPVGHPVTHSPAEQTRAAHERPQLPQFRLSLVRSTHASEQSVSPDWQAQLPDSQL
jgi:hypothetical protein